MQRNEYMIYIYFFKQLVDEFKQLVDKFLSCEAITHEVADYMVFNRHLTVQLCMLPKLYKPTQPSPGKQATPYKPGFKHT